jgi:multiple sugar transport system substrate-binding protein
MKEIVISHMDTTPLDLADFESVARVKVRHHLMQWAKAWGELMPIALFNQGPDLSEIGNTWLGSLCSMNALRPFTPAEIEKIDAPQAFLPAVWKTGRLPNDENIYGIPFTTDTRLLLYRRDLLARCGIDENTAFRTTDQMYETLACLQSAGVEIPWLVSTVDEIHHFVASWIWGAGGDFHEPDSTHLSLTDPRTIEGIYQFYRLHRFIPPQARNLSVTECDQLFRNGGAAVVYTIHGTIDNISRYKTPALPEEIIGAAKVPGVSFVGGSQFVVWKHSLIESSAFELIRYLTSVSYQSALFRTGGNLPVLAEVLSEEPYKSHPLYKVSFESLQTGRAIQSVPRWAAVETRISIMLQQLWQVIFDNPDLDLRAEIVCRVTEVSDRLENTILSA